MGRPAGRRHRDRGCRQNCDRAPAPGARVRTLGALEARYADDHVPLALVLGAMGTLSAVRKLVPDDLLTRARQQSGGSESEAGSRPPPEAFIALLIGAVATY